MLKVPDAGPGSRPGKEALGPRSDVAVTNAVLAQATPLSFVCSFESDLWFARNRNGLEPLTHLSGYICDKISRPVPAKQRVDGEVSFELNIRLEEKSGIFSGHCDCDLYLGNSLLRVSSGKRSIRDCPKLQTGHPRTVSELRVRLVWPHTVNMNGFGWDPYSPEGPSLPLSVVLMPSRLP